MLIFPESYVVSSKEGDPTRVMIYRMADTCSNSEDRNQGRQGPIGGAYTYAIPAELAGRTVYVNWSERASDSGDGWWNGAWMHNDRIPADRYQGMEKATVCGGTWFKVLL